MIWNNATNISPYDNQFLWIHQCNFWNKQQIVQEVFYKSLTIRHAVLWTCMGTLFCKDMKKSWKSWNFIINCYSLITKETTTTDFKHHFCYSLITKQRIAFDFKFYFCYSLVTKQPQETEQSEFKETSLQADNQETFDLFVETSKENNQETAKKLPDVKWSRF